MNLLLLLHLFVLCLYFCVSKASLAGHSVTKRQIFPGRTSPCVQTSRSCPSAAASGQCLRNPVWMLSNCQVSCGNCRKCNEPNHIICMRYMRAGYCRSYSAYMSKNCPFSCGLCCFDTRSMCSVWARRGFCRTNRVYMSRACRRSCLICKDFENVKPSPQPKKTTTKTKPRPPLKKTTNAITTIASTTLAPILTTVEHHKKSSGLNGTLCGLKLIQSVVGGKTAKKEQWPWMAGLFHISNPKKVLCGGALINDQWIVTASHCFQDYPLSIASEFLVRLGEADLTKDEGTEVTIVVSNKILHSGFNLTTYDNDIALLKLSQKVKFGKAIRPICIPPESSKVPVSRFCYIAGWGRVGEHQQQSIILKQAQIPLVDDATCKKSFLSSPDYIITENMFCGGDASGKTDACQGDSGGPLICMGDTFRLTLMGVVSWGKGCARIGTYGVYTKVSQYASWLENNVLMN